MNARTRNLALAGSVVLVTGFLLLNTISPAPVADPGVADAPGPPGTTARSSGPALGGPSPAQTDSSLGRGAPTEGHAAPTEDSGSVTGAADLRGYALPVAELSGLPPDAAPGTELELWVAWDPPITERPRLQKLIPRAVLEKIAPAVTPEGPDVAILLVPVKRLPDLFYADRYGALSVALLPSP